MKDNRYSGVTHNTACCDDDFFFFQHKGGQMTKMVALQRSRDTSRFHTYIQVDMLTSPVAAARAAVATGAWVKSKHDMYLIHGSVGA